MAIRVAREGAVSWITIKRPEVLNALDIPHLEALLAAFEGAAKDEASAVLVLTGHGRAFSAGADIKAMAAMGEAEFARMSALFQALARAARGLAKPLLCAVNGHCIGGGLELAMMCDLRIAARSARFRLPDAEHGFSPTGGLSYLLPRAIGLGRAFHMLWTCEDLDAAAAERWGLVSAAVDDDALAGRVGAIAARLARCPGLGLANIKEALHAGAESGFEASLARELKLDAGNRRNPETRANLTAFAARRRGGG